MRRTLALRLSLASCAPLLLAGAASAQAYTTRIETRPFYGATVTLEEGVRVFRPLPPERHVIINPDGTPLSLSFNETRVYENRVIRHQHESESDAQIYGRSGVAYGVFGGRRARGIGGRSRGYGTRQAPRVGVQ